MKRIDLRNHMWGIEKFSHWKMVSQMKDLMSSFNFALGADNGILIDMDIAKWRHNPLKEEDCVLDVIEYQPLYAHKNNGTEYLVICYVFITAFLMWCSEGVVCAHKALLSGDVSSFWIWFSSMKEHRALFPTEISSRSSVDLSLVVAIEYHIGTTPPAVLRGCLNAAHQYLFSRLAISYTDICGGPALYLIDVGVLRSTNSAPTAVIK